MSEEMIEKVAIAIRDVTQGEGFDYMDFCRDAARAAIAAYNPNERLTTVTDAMLCAGGSAVVKTAHLTGCERARIIYAAMIEAAPRNPNERLTALEDRLLEAEVRAHGWIVAHDKLKAGKPYDFPSPADLPEALKGVERLREALERIALLGKNALEGHLTDDEAWAMMDRAATEALTEETTK